MPYYSYGKVKQKNNENQLSDSSAINVIEDETDTLPVVGLTAILAETGCRRLL